MPKKASEAKKPRKSSSASKDVTSTSPSGNMDVVIRPPNPVATHLVASNPFDDPPPSSSMKIMHNFPGQSVMRMPGPGGPMGSGFPGWNPRSGGMRSPYGTPGAPGWNGPMPGNGSMGHHPMYHPNLPPQSNMPSNGYSRQPFPGGGMQAYRGPSRMSMNNMRPNMGPLGSPDPEALMHESQSLGHSHIPSGNHGHMLQNTGQMKALTRPGSQKSSPATRKNSTKSLSGDSKSPKNPDSATKVRKKSEKKRNTDADKLASLNGTEHYIPFHSIPPKEPQSCKRCNRTINHLEEDAICCIASCNVWYHRTCVGLTAEAYKLLKGEELAIWACDLCLQTKEIQSVRSRTSFIEGQIANA